MTVNMHAILVGLLSVSHTPEQADHAAREVLNQHAHELAEQIRAAWNAHDPKKPGNVTMLSALNAADLIDSEVQR